MTQRKLIFFHIPKTAGTSLRDELRRHFQPDELCLLYQRDDFQSGLRRFLQNEQKLCMGHFGWEDELISLAGDALLITFLRRPVQRVISHYLQFQRSPYPEHQRYRQMSFGEFLNQPMARNWQCRRLGGGFYDSQRSDEECFRQASANISERFEVVGLVEEMSESLQWLKEESGLDLKDPPHLNPKHLAPEAPFMRWEEEIARVNQWDEKLYQLAYNRLMARS